MNSQTNLMSGGIALRMLQAVLRGVRAVDSDGPGAWFVHQVLLVVGRWSARQSGHRMVYSEM